MHCEKNLLVFRGFYFTICPNQRDNWLLFWAILTTFAASTRTHIFPKCTIFYCIRKLGAEAENCGEMVLFSFYCRTSTLPPWFSILPATALWLPRDQGPFPAGDSLENWRSCVRTDRRGWCVLCSHRVRGLILGATLGVGLQRAKGGMKYAKTMPRLMLSTILQPGDTLCRTMNIKLLSF